MAVLELALVEWPPGGSEPQLLGRTTDSELIEVVRVRLAAQRRRELSRLDRPVRLVERAESDLDTSHR